MDQALRIAGPGDSAANWVASRQHGVIHARQARRCGLGRRAIAGRCTQASWQRLQPRAYLIGGHSAPDRARILAATLDAGPCAAATGQAAGFLYGITSRLRAPIDLAMVGRHNAATRSGTRIHRPRGLAWDNVRFLHGIPTVCPIEMLIALAGTDMDSDVLEAACAMALHKGLVSRTSMRQALAESPPRPGLPRLRLVARDPSLTRSRNERRMLSLVRRAELPTPQTNVVIGGKEVDLYWPEANLGVEVDAYSTHGELLPFEDDRKVDADLEAIGVRILRFTDRRIRSHPEAVLAKLTAVLTLRLGGLPSPRRR